MTLTNTPAAEPEKRKRFRDADKVPAVFCTDLNAHYKGNGTLVAQALGTDSHAHVRRSMRHNLVPREWEKKAEDALCVIYPGVRKHGYDAIPAAVRAQAAVQRKRWDAELGRHPKPPVEPIPAHPPPQEPQEPVAVPEEPEPGPEAVPEAAGGWLRVEVEVRGGQAEAGALYAKLMEDLAGRIIRKLTVDYTAK